MDDDDIDFVEQFIRKKGCKFVKQIQNEESDSIAENNDVSEDEYDPADVFGEIFATCPDKFQFLRGDRNTIKLIVAHVKSLVDGKGENKGLKQFNQRKQKNRKNIGHLSNADRDAKMQRTCSATSHQTNHFQLTSKLHEMILNSLKPYNADVSNCNDNIVDVDASGTYGIVTCILCPNDIDEKERKKRVYYSRSKHRSHYWVISNYTKHLKRKHSSTLKTEKKNAIMESQFELVGDDNLLDDARTTQDVVSLNEIDPMNANNDAVSESMEGEYADYSVEIVDVIIQQPTTVSSDNTDSWAYIQIAEQIQQMVAEQLINSEKTEHMEFKLKDQIARLIHVIKAPDDGNCLFTSLAHQLWPVAITSEDSKKNARRLRATVVEHILNATDFTAYQMIIEERLSELSDLVDDDASLETKCKMWVRHILSRQRKWGGLETIKAVSCMHRVNVLVFNECGTAYVIKGSNETHNRTILIAYRLGQNLQHGYVYNHYDSVCDMESNSIYATSEFILNRN